MPPASRGAAGGRGAARGGANPPSAAPARKPAAARPPWQGPLDAAKGGVDAENKPPGYVEESLASTLPRFRRAIHVGDRVVDKHSKREGICLYVGPADFARGKEVVGLRLDKKRTTTDCDGKYRGERYFRCTQGHGLYIPLEDAEFGGLAGDADVDHVNKAGGGGGGGGGGSTPQDGARRLDRRPTAAAELGGDVGGPAADFDLDKELDPIVGLSEVKEMLRGMRNMVEIRKKRAGMGVNDERTMHMLFLGNPGTGKTTVARLVARMLHSLGVLKKGQLIEVTRKDLIGAHHGETAQLTADACKRAMGGVLVRAAPHARPKRRAPRAHRCRPPPRPAPPSLLRGAVSEPPGRSKPARGPAASRACSGGPSHALSSRCATSLFHLSVPPVRARGTVHRRGVRAAQ